jgi:FAD/FMN-containing dehydrogenase
MVQIPEAPLQTLAASFSGVLLQPADAGYENARRVHNGLIDKRPALIAQCRSTADIVDALNFARDSGLPVSVRGGGHNVAGRAVVDGGVMIDLSLMKGIYVDPQARTIRAQGGVLWREFNREAGLYGLATTGGFISTTGIAGLTLGGGLGALMGKYALAADNLLSVELVTAAGEALTANAEQHPDLFWALRGGGGNFGVAASLEYRLHPLQQVVGGLIAHPIAAAKDLLRFYRDFTASVPDELSLMAALVFAPDGSGTPLAAFVICHSGSPEQAEADLRPVREFGNPLMVEVGPMPYPVVNTLLDNGFPRGALNYWKSNFVRGLEDGLIDAVIDGFAACPSQLSAIVFEHFHGAVTRIGLSDTPVPHREPGYNVVIPGVWTDPAQTDATMTWVRRTYAAVEPYFVARKWLNYLADDEGADAIQAAYGPNYARLAQVKRRYDPDNLFRQNHNITPAVA